MAIPEVEIPFELVYEDGEPLETIWHRDQMDLLIEVFDQALLRQGREDFVASGNNFIYYSLEQARRVATEPIATTRHFRGPDVFLVLGVDPDKERQCWVVWEEDGRYPDLIFELLSPKTARIDRTVKKRIYEQTFATPEYFLYDPNRDLLEGYRLEDGRYRALTPDARGHLPTRVLDGSFGRWRGRYRHRPASLFIRLHDAEGRLVPTDKEEAEEHRAQRRAAEEEAARLRARLAELEGR